MTRYVVAKAADVAPGGHILVQVRGRNIGIFRVGDEYYGLLNRCPHKGGPMCEGHLVGELNSDRPGDYRREESGRTFVECPWHGWEFDVATGQSFFDPRKMKVRPYPVEVEKGGDLVTELEDDDPAGTKLVEGPYLAEKVPISVEDDYLIVHAG